MAQMNGVDCTHPGAIPPDGTGNNDALGWVDGADDPSLTHCPMVQLVGTQPNGPFSPVTPAGVSKPPVLGQLEVPRVAFSTGAHLYSLFRIPDPTVPNDPLLIHGQLQFGRWVESDPPTTTQFDLVGTPFDQKGVSTTGPAIDFFTTIAAHCPNPSDLADLVADKTFRDHLPPGVKTPIFLFGRQSIYAVTRIVDDVRVHGPTDLFLMVIDADALDGLKGPSDAVDGLLWYFAGVPGTPPEANDWIQVTGGAGARPVFAGRLSERRVIAQMTLTYDANLKMWILLYGGGATDTNAVLPIDSDFQLGPLGPGPHGIALRWARYPWGPWSLPISVYDGRADGHPDQMLLVDDALFTGSVNKPMAVPGVTPNNAAFPDDLSAAGERQIVPGVEYGASIWQGAGLSEYVNNGKIASKPLYFAMSTFDPYHVVLMRTVIVSATSHVPPPIGFTIVEAPLSLLG